MVNFQKLKTMKKYYAIFAAVLFLAAPSCTKQEKFVDTPNGEITLETISLTAGKEARDIPVAPQSKAFIDGTAVLWESTDQVRIYDNVAPATPHDFSVTPSDPASSAELSGQVAEGSSHFHAVSPAAAGVSISGSDITLNLPAAQVIPAGKNVSGEALLSVASADRGNALEFKNVCGFLKVEVSYKNVKSITVTGEKIAGTATVDAATGQIKDNSSATGSVTVTYAEGEVFPTGVYYIAVLPGTTPAGGFTVSLTQDIAGFSATKTATQAVPIARNGGFDFAKLDTTLAWEYLISNADELVAWNARYAEWKATDIVKLTANIDMSGKEWTPHIFTGKFDGQNHIVNNIVVTTTASNCGFFASMTGSASLSNLIVGKKFDADEYDGVSTFTQNSTRTGSYDFVAIVPALQNTAVMTNVTNYAKMVVAEASTPRLFRAGGICAQWSSTRNAENLKNYGEVYVAAIGNSADKNGSLAGVISFINQPITISGCENHGYVHTAHEYIYNIGGVLSVSNKVITITDCKNYGKIEYSGTAELSATNIGGIVPQMTAGSTVSNSENHGKVTSTLSSDASNTFNIGGIIGYAANLSISHCSNYGTVSAEGEFARKEFNVGGVVGYCNATKCTVEYCSSKKGTYENGTAYESTVFNESPSAYLTAVGGICGKAKTADHVFENCVNEGKVYNEGVCSNVKYGQEGNGSGGIGVGGVLGILDSGAIELTNCSNTGAVYDSSKSTWLKVGGILGYAHGAGVIFDCSNSGNVSKTVSASANTFIGGILGHNMTTALTQFEGCVNNASGAVSVTTTSAATRAFVGGIVGWIQAVASSITNCDNSAPVSFSGTTAANYTYMGGIAGAYDCTGTMSGCDNSGNITNNGANSTDKGFRVGGLVGACNAAATYDNCSVSADVSNTAKVTVNHAFGGLIGLPNGNNAKVQNCKFYGNVADHAESTNKYLGGLIGMLSNNITLDNNGVGGSVDGVALTAENFETHLYKMSGSPTVTTNTPNYYWNGE